MKKILLYFIVVISLFAIIRVDASTFSASIVGNNSFEDEITLYVQVNNLVDFNGSCNGLCGLVGNLTYDSEKLELISINALENFDLTQGSKIVLYKTSGVPSGTNVLSMKFKNKSLIKDETTTISLTNIVGSDGDQDITTSNTSKTIKFIVKEQETTQVATTKATTKAKTTTKRVETTTNSKTTENNLKSITLSNGKIDFNKDVLVYDVVVGYDVESIEINAISENSKATIEGLGKHELKVGSNKITLSVSSSDGSEKIYTINVNREKQNIEVTEENLINNDSNNIKDSNSSNVVFGIVIGIGILAILVTGIYYIKKNR